jgi:hypothetical protein
MPSLCMAGLLSHPCAHGEERAQCGHEEDCPADPCDVAMVHPSNPDNRIVGSRASQISGPVCAGAYRAVPAEPEGGRSRPCDRSPPMVALPFPASDVPLLI